MQVRKRDTLRIYALKTLRKAHIVSRSEVTHTLAERTVLAQVNCPFIVPLKFSFQSKEKLYLVLAFVNGGELFHHLQREGKFNETRSRFYAAELLSALEHLHGFNVIYRYVPPVLASGLQLQIKAVALGRHGAHRWLETCYGNGTDSRRRAIPAFEDIT